MAIQHQNKFSIRLDITVRTDHSKTRETRPSDDRYPSNEGRRLYDRLNRNRDDRPYSKPERNYENDEKEEKRQPPTAPENTPLVKPNGHGIFSKPRMPPKIKRPVPLNEKEKYEYVTIATTKAPPKSDDEYYDDYEEEDMRKPQPSAKTSIVQRPKYEPVEKEKFKPTRPHSASVDKYKKPKKPIDYEEDEYYDEPPAKSQKYTYNPRTRDERPPKLKDEDYYYDEKERNAEKQKRKYIEEDITSKIKEVRPNVKIVRRPFLPSRGGSPYLPRGLQPVAGKDLNSPPSTTPKPTSTSTTTTSTSTTTTTTTTTTPEPPTTTVPSTTTEHITTTIATEKPTVTSVPEEEYEYYDEEDIEYESKEKKGPTTTAEATQAAIKEVPTTTTTTTTTQETTTHDKAKLLATKVLRNFNDQYEAMKEQLESTLTPGDYLKPYLGHTPTQYREIKTKKPEPRPEISKGYSATGKPLKIPDIKQNLADSVENDYDVSLNEAIIPKPVRLPSGFIVPSDRDYSFSRFRSNLNSEPQYAASEISHYQVRKRPMISGVSIRTPSSYYIQPQRLVYDDELVRPPRQLVYRQFGF